MLPTCVIGLREGLEAALIVAIIAAFLRRQGRRDLIRWVFIGGGTAVLLCAAAGLALHISQRSCRSAGKSASRPSSARWPSARAHPPRGATEQRGPEDPAPRLLLHRRHRREHRPARCRVVLHRLPEGSAHAVHPDPDAAGPDRPAQRVHPAHWQRAVRRGAWAARAGRLLRQGAVQLTDSLK